MYYRLFFTKSSLDSKFGFNKARRVESRLQDFYIADCVRLEITTSLFVYDFSITRMCFFDEYVAIYDGEVNRIPIPYKTLYKLFDDGFATYRSFKMRLYTIDY